MVNCPKYKKMTFDEKRMIFMEYIKGKYKPLIVYYPASGADMVPKKVFGETSVIHLSLPENEKEVKYLERLGNGIKLLGDMEESPLADSSVDLIWICLRGGRVNGRALKDFMRVLKKGGLIAVEESQNTDGNRHKWQELLDCFNDLERVELPDNFEKPETVYSFSETDAYDSQLVVNSEKEMIDEVSGKGGKYVGYQYVFDYALFSKR